MPLPAAWSNRSVTSAAAFPCPPASSAVRSLTRNTDHIVYRNSSLRSRALGLLAASAAPGLVPPGWVNSCSSAMSPIVGHAKELRHLTRRRARRGDAGGYPDSLVGRPADGQARLSGDGRPDPRHPVQMPDRVLRQRAAPPGNTVRGRSALHPGRGRELGGGHRGQILIAPLHQGFLADTADR